MAINAFVTFFDKADGESIQKGKEKWVEIQGWDWEVEAESSWTKGGGASVGKPNPGKLNFEHLFDTSSTVILGYICTGKAFPKFELQMTKTTGKGTPETYFTMTMEGVFITKVSNCGHRGRHRHAEGRNGLQDREDRIQAPGQQDRRAGRCQDLQLGYPGRHSLAVGLTRRGGTARRRRAPAAALPSV